MKKVIILAITTVAFASCTKDYTCNCSNDATGETNQMVYKTNKKSHATRLCNDWEIRTQTAVPEESTTECKID